MKKIAPGRLTGLRNRRFTAYTLKRLGTIYLAALRPRFRVFSKPVRLPPLFFYVHCFTTKKNVYFLYDREFDKYLQRK